MNCSKIEKNIYEIEKEVLYFIAFIKKYYQINSNLFDFSRDYIAKYLPNRKAYSPGLLLILGDKGIVEHQIQEAERMQWNEDYKKLFSSPFFDDFKIDISISFSENGEKANIAFRLLNEKNEFDYNLIPNNRYILKNGAVLLSPSKDFHKEYLYYEYYRIEGY